MNLLSKAEMKRVLGGNTPVGGGDDCPAAECTKDSDCASSQYGKTCKITNCLSTDKPANYCYTPSV
ncbi:hypothetical protein [Pedobacter riviphilus]|nr:hypothetical protein [Pedobacter riviphilus]